MWAAPRLAKRACALAASPRPLQWATVERLSRSFFGVAGGPAADDGRAGPFLRSHYWTPFDVLVAVAQAALHNLQEDIKQTERIVSSVCGLSAGIGLACLAASCIDGWEWQHIQDSSHMYEEIRSWGRSPSSELDLPPRLGSDSALAEGLARQLIRKNSRLAVEEAYTFVSEPPLGEGAFGVVLRAVHNRSGIERAVKRIDKGAVPDPGMLVREVEALRLLDHPHVCRLVEYFETSQHLWLVTELCRGEELCSRLLDMPGGLPEPEVSALMAQMLRATLHCHRRAVVHRDLKPENFLFAHAGGAQGGAGALKLIDFGFAVPAAASHPGAAGGACFAPAVSSKAASAVDGVPVAGTLLYMSPQVLRNEAPTLSDDIWSLGVIFYILLSGKFPFSTNDDNRFQEMCDSGQLRADVAEHLASLQASRAAVDLVHRMLAFDPKDRISAEQALQHPFLAEGLRSTGGPAWLDPAAVRDRCARFWRSCRLRRVVAAAIAQLMDESWGDRERARATFLSLDRAGDGRISLSDLRDFLRSRGLHAPSAWCRPPAYAGEANGMSYTTFVAAMLGDEVLNDERILRAAFDLLDADGDGAVSAEDLRRRLGLSHAEGGQAIAEALEEVAAAQARSQLPAGDLAAGAARGRGAVSYADFLRLMRGPTN